jgi:hypothetical protein
MFKWFKFKTEDEYIVSMRQALKEIRTEIFNLSKYDIEEYMERCVDKKIRANVGWLDKKMHELIDADKEREERLKNIELKIETILSILRVNK